MIPKFIRKGECLVCFKPIYGCDTEPQVMGSCEHLLNIRKPKRNWLERIKEQLSSALRRRTEGGGGGG